MTKIITVEQSRSLEQKANAGGLGYAAMMENAGRAVAEVIRRRHGVTGKRVLILVGPGNNGGDGLVAAYHLSRLGAQATCYLWRREISADENLRRASEAGIRMVWAKDDEDQADLRRLAVDAHVWVDALLGVGGDRPIEGSLLDLIEAVQEVRSGAGPGESRIEAIAPVSARAAPLVVAVDCPTGLNCDTGALDPAALPADLTVTFAHPKAGLLRLPGAEAVGQLVVADIGIPPQLAAGVWLEMATPGLVRSRLPVRPLDAHKGTFGSALLVAGSVNYTGAAVLAGEAATRVGTGLVTMGVPLSIQPVVAAHLKEATFLLLPHDLGVIAFDAVHVVEEQAHKYQALLVGPGLGQEKETTAFVGALLGLERRDRRSRIGFLSDTAAGVPARPALPPLVVDADGLNALAQSEGWWRSLPPDTILTPHPGEMSRLMGGSVTAAEIQADREGLARRMAAAWSVVVVLKGAFTVVASPAGQVCVVPFANPGLATAGTGDVLAGAVVGLRAQGMAAFDAAVAGAYLHGLAGKLAADQLGDMGMVAGDISVRLPLALKVLRWGGEV